MVPQDNDGNFNSIGQSRRDGISHNAGFQVGVFGGLVLGILHLGLFVFINTQYSPEMIVLWFVKFVVCFVGGYKAAMIQYDRQRESVDALNGVQSAGSGAGLLISLFTWFFIFLGAIIRDLMGRQVIIEPVSLCTLILLDVILAIGLGSLGGKRVVNKYKIFDV